MTDKCRPVVVDGEIIRVRGGRPMNEADRAAFAEIVRAAKRLMAARAAAAADATCTCDGLTSATGADTTPDGPDKTWICDHCGLVVTT